MSGDVQPRKRKDKRRKKADGDYHIQRIRASIFDDEDTGTPPPTLVNPSSEQSTDNVTIHVHKESGTGGHWCAKIIFFALLIALVGLVGIIIFENRGITDVDTPVASSRWAVVFDGWVDDILPQHEEDHPSEEAEEEGSEHDDHDEEEEEEAEAEAEAEAEEEEEEEEEESAEADKEEDEGIGSDEEQVGESEDDDINEDGDDDDDDDDEQGSVEEDSRQNAYEESEEATIEHDEDDENDEKLDDNSDEGYNEEDDMEDDNEDLGTLEEVDNASEEEERNVEDAVDEDQEDEEEDDNNASDNDLDVSIEGVETSTERDDDNESRELFTIPGVGEIDDNSVEPLEEIEDGELEEVVNELEIEPDEEEIEEESSSVAVKFGVGVALIVAAHFVLVRRWNNVEAELAGSYSDQVLDLSRRNTIVPPTNPKDTDASVEASEQTVPKEKIVESYEELRVKYKSLQVDSPDMISVEKTLIKNESTPEKGTTEDRRVFQRKEQVEDMQTSESERMSATEPEDEEDDEEEEEDSEEEDDEEEEEEEEEEEVEDVDDSELVAKLEAKYGKLPTPTESEEDDEDEDYEEEDEEEDEDDEEETEQDDTEIQGWKRVKAPKGHPEVASEQRNESKRKEASASKGRQGPSGNAGGKATHEHVNDSSMDEVSIQEEINSWLSKELDN